MRIIGLTGGIASGKSLVTEMFRALGVPVIDTDEIARQVVAPSHPAWRRLTAAFPACFTAAGTLDRAALAHRVFADSDARRLLESITHPAIFAEVDRQLAELRQSPTPPSLVIVAVPLLFEVGAAERFDATVLVIATPEQQRDRLMRLRHYTRADADARMAAQLPLEDKRRRAQYCIDNTGTPEATRTHILELLPRLQHEVTARPDV